MPTVISVKGVKAIDVLLGARIQKRRLDLGLSQTALGGAVGLSIQQIQKYELGFDRISCSRLVEISRALDLRVADLLFEIDEPIFPTLNGENDNLRLPGAPQLLAAYAAMSITLREAVRGAVIAIVKACIDDSIVDHVEP